MMPPVSFPVTPGPAPTKPAWAANDVRTTATASIERMGRGSSKSAGDLSAIAMCFSSIDAGGFRDLTADVVFAPYRPDRVAVVPTSFLAASGAAEGAAATGDGSPGCGRVGGRFCPAGPGSAVLHGRVTDG